jgi:hypothetical protein
VIATIDKTLAIVATSSIVNHILQKSLPNGQEFFI